MQGGLVHRPHNIIIISLTGFEISRPALLFFDIEQLLKQLFVLKSGNFIARQIIACLYDCSK